MAFEVSAMTLCWWHTPPALFTPSATMLLVSDGLLLLVTAFWWEDDGDKNGFGHINCVGEVVVYSIQDVMLISWSSKP